MTSQNNKVILLFRISQGLCTLFSFIVLSSFVFADEVNYSYDDAGRLVRIEKGTEQIIYQYDEVGNLISIVKESGTSQALPPVLQGIEPDIFIIGNTYNVAITGQNLLTTSSITSNNPNITIKNFIPMDTKIFATISILSGASLGKANITVATSYGSVSMSVNLYKVNLTPKTLSLFPISTASISASLIPSAPKDAKVFLLNSNPDIIYAPSSLVIPAGGSANFTIKALKEGTGAIDVGDAEATVLVLGGGVLVDATPVSVSINIVPNNALINASHVVSVAWPVIVNYSVSMPASVQWLIVPDAITVSDPVCVKIEAN